MRDVYYQIVNNAIIKFLNVKFVSLAIDYGLVRFKQQPHNKPMAVKNVLITVLIVNLIEMFVNNVLVVTF